jgi:hypothetical protein
MKPTYNQILENLNIVLYNSQKYQAIAQLKVWAEEEGMKGQVAEYIATASQRSNQNNNGATKVEPRVLIQTKPGTVGVIFDKWLANGWEAENLITPKYPDGQVKALEAMRGYNKYGAPTNDFRDLTMDTLSPQQAKYFSMLEDNYNRWQRTKK